MQAEIYEFFEGTLGCLAPWKNLFAEAAKSQAQNDWQYHHDLFGAIVQSHRLNLTALYEEGDRECAFAESAPKSYSFSVSKARLQQKGTVNYWARYRDNDEERRTSKRRPKEDANLKLVAYLYSSTLAAYNLNAGLLTYVRVLSETRAFRWGCVAKNVGSIWTGGRIIDRCQLSYKVAEDTAKDQLKERRARCPRRQGQAMGTHAGPLRKSCRPQARIQTR